MTSLKVYSTFQYARYLQETIKRDFPGVEIEPEEEIEYTEDVARARFRPGRILIPGSNYGSIDLMEDRKLVGRAKVPAFFVSRVEDIPQGLVLLSRFSNEREMKRFYEMDNPRDFVSFYLISDVTRF